MPTFQAFSVSVRTDSNANFSFAFDTAIDMALASVANPQNGQDSALIGITCDQTGTKTVKCRVWRSGANFTAKPAVNETVLVTLLGVKN